MPAARPVGFTATLKLTGVVPLAGVTVNQAAFDLALTLALPGPAETAIDCAAGAEPPV